LLVINRTAHKISFILTDFLAAFLAWILFYTTRKYLLGEESAGISSSVLLHASLVAAFWMLLYTLLGAYRYLYRQSRVKALFTLAQVSLMGGLVIFFGLLLDDQGVQHYQAYYKTLAAYFGIHFFLAALSKTAHITYHQYLVRSGQIRFNTLLVGASDKALEVYQDLDKNNRPLGLHVIGYVEVIGVGASVFQDGPANLGVYQALPALIASHQVEEVVVALDPSEHRQIEAILGTLEGQQVRISILPDLYQILLGSVKVTHLFGTPLIQIKQDLMPVWQNLAKRTTDLVFSLLGLILLFPLFLVLGLLVKLSSPGPILYRQERIGKGGQPFTIFKFRSMYLDAEKNGPALSYDQDPRVTAFGGMMRKVHLDELPQFYNVMRGQMSLVGPRPERQYFIDLILEKAPHYRHLLRVRPGITSLGLVKFGYAQNVAEMIRRMSYDILYIENMSLAMDLRVMLYTIKVIIEGRGK
jgi:exopolysaccharide biosynthesis polyprenyl glycosylphosphotransferase